MNLFNVLNVFMFHAFQTLPAFKVLFYLPCLEEELGFSLLLTGEILLWLLQVVCCFILLLCNLFWFFFFLFREDIFPRTTTGPGVSVTSRRICVKGSHPALRIDGEMKRSQISLSLNFFFSLSSMTATLRSFSCTVVRLE